MDAVYTCTCLVSVLPNCLLCSVKDLLERGKELGEKCTKLAVALERHTLRRYIRTYMYIHFHLITTHTVSPHIFPSLEFIVSLSV